MKVETSVIESDFKPFSITISVDNSLEKEALKNLFQANLRVPDMLEAENCIQKKHKKTLTNMMGEIHNAISDFKG